MGVLRKLARWLLSPAAHRSDSGAFNTIALEPYWNLGYVGPAGGHFTKALGDSNVLWSWGLPPHTVSTHAQ